jgi:hypothetical protein
MPFRPEEVHGRSGISDVFKPFPERNGYIGHVSEGFFIQDPAVLEHDLKRFTTVQTREIYRYLFAREEPADRQRFESSLAEPFLPAVDGDAVMGGEVVKGCKRYDVVGPWIQPSGDA